MFFFYDLILTRHLLFVLGYVKNINGMIIAKVCNELGAGRQFSDQEINPAVGVRVLMKIGDYIKRNATCIVLYHDKIDLNRSFITSLLDSIELTSEIVEPVNIVLGVIDCNSF